jgi:hypothetical protein
MLPFTEGPSRLRIFVGGVPLKQFAISLRSRTGALTRFLQDGLLLRWVRHRSGYGFVGELPAYHLQG